MDSMKTYVLIWLSGVIAGLVMVERWRGRRTVAARGGDHEHADETASTERLHHPSSPSSPC